VNNGQENYEVYQQDIEIYDNSNTVITKLLQNEMILVVVSETLFYIMHSQDHLNRLLKELILSWFFDLPVKLDKVRARVGDVNVSFVIGFDLSHIRQPEEMITLISDRIYLWLLYRDLLSTMDYAERRFVSVN